MIRIGWIVAVVCAAAVRLWNVLYHPLMRGYDDHGHVGYVLYLDLYGSVPWADQGWSYFHPPLHYTIGWLLAQADDPQILLRGLAAVASACSLAIAWMAARLSRLAAGNRPAVPLLVFVCVAFLPVFLYTSTMAGNELTAAFLCTLGFLVFVENDVRPVPSLRRDIAVGVLLGLAMLTKASAALVLAAVGLALLLRGMRAGANAAAWRAVAARGIAIAGIAGLLASPYYLRNVREFGTPLKLSRDTAIVSRLESQQPPGSRSGSDLIRVSPRLFVDPDPTADHMLHSIWGSAYAQTWADVRSIWAAAPDSEKPRILRWQRVGVIVGLGPTLLALLGAGLVIADLRRRRRVDLYVPLLCLAGISLVAFAVFAFEVPHFSALKASYLLALTLPFAAFLGRGLEALSGLSLGTAVGAVPIGAAALASAGINAQGIVLPRIDDHWAMGTLLYYFERFDEARTFFEQGSGDRLGSGRIWTDNLGALELASGRPSRAREYYRVHPPIHRRAWHRVNAVAVTAALGGRERRALDEIDAAIAAGAAEVGLNNRGAIRARLGDLGRAERDLRKALAADPALVPALHNLAEVLRRQGRREEALVLRRRAEEAASGGPRGHPYGIPESLGQSPYWKINERWMLWLADDALALARAPFRPEDARLPQERHPTTATHPNLVLVVVDTLRADHLGAYGYERPTSPNLDALARDGDRFARAHAPSSWTLPSVASLFTSLAPSQHAVTAWQQRIARGLQTLPERLFDAGYATIGISGNFVHVNEHGGFARGFEHFEALSRPADGPDEALLGLSTEEETLSLRAATGEEINEAVFAALPPSGGRPLYLYVHYMEPHSAYDPPPAQRAAFAPDPAPHERVAAATAHYVNALARGEETADEAERRRLVALYDAEIASVDAAIGALLDGLAARGYGESLVVAVTSDHGEEFADHGGWFHGLTLHEELLAVPLIVRDFRRPGPGRVRHEPVDLLDVPTTLLALAGVEPDARMAGRPLLSTDRLRSRRLQASLEPDPLFEESVAPRRHLRSAIDWPWKVIVDVESNIRVYHLERDPLERAPLALSDAEIPQDVKRTASALGQLPSRPPSRGPRLTPEARERLRALGYAR